MCHPALWLFPLGGNVAVLADWAESTLPVLLGISIVDLDRDRGDLVFRCGLVLLAG